MRTKHPLLIIVAAIILAPGMFPLQGFSQAPFYQKADGTTKFDILPGGETVMRRRLLERFHSPPSK